MLARPAACLLLCPEPLACPAAVRCYLPREPLQGPERQEERHTVKMAHAYDEDIYYLYTREGAQTHEAS